MTPAEASDMRLIKSINTSGKVSIIKIYPEENMVIKKFKRTEWLNDLEKKKYRGSLNSCFLRELKCLQALKNYEHFPQLIDFDEVNLHIRMSYCGTKLEPELDNSRFLPQARKIINVLRDKKILIPRISSDTIRSQRAQIGRLYHNLLVKNEKLYFIDFEEYISFPLKL